MIACSNVRIITTSTMREMTRATSSIGSPRDSCVSPRFRLIAMPPSWFMPASNDTRVRVTGLLEHHRERAVAQRLVELVALEAVLDPARALEQVRELVGGEVLELQEVLSVPWRVKQRRGAARPVSIRSFLTRIVGLTPAP